MVLNSAFDKASNPYTTECDEWYLSHSGAHGSLAKEHSVRALFLLTLFIDKLFSFLLQFFVDSKT